MEPAAPRKRLAVSFTGGKDCTLALHIVSGELQRALDGAPAAAGGSEPFSDDALERFAPFFGHEVALLVTFGPKDAETAFRAHPMPLIRAQAAALGLPHAVCTVEGPDYEAAYRANIAALKADHGIDALVTGDIVDVCNGFMCRAVAGSGVELWRPLWGIERRQLLHLIWALDLKVLITCVHLDKFKPSLNAAAAATAAAAAAGGSGEVGGRRQAAAPIAAAAAAAATAAEQAAAVASAAASAAAGAAAAGGDSAAAGGDVHVVVEQVLGAALTRSFHEGLLSRLAAAHNVDEAGEWGEFHTAVLDGPLFTQALALAAAEKRVAGGFCFFDVQRIEAVSKA